MEFNPTEYLSAKDSLHFMGNIEALLTSVRRKKKPMDLFSD